MSVITPPNTNIDNKPSKTHEGISRCRDWRYVLIDSSTLYQEALIISLYKEFYLQFSRFLKLRTLTYIVPATHSMTVSLHVQDIRLCLQVASSQSSQLKSPSRLGYCPCR